MLGGRRERRGGKQGGAGATPVKKFEQQAGTAAHTQKKEMTMEGRNHGVAIM